MLVLGFFWCEASWYCAAAEVIWLRLELPIDVLALLFQVYCSRFVCCFLADEVSEESLKDGLLCNGCGCLMLFICAFPLACRLSFMCPDWNCWDRTSICCATNCDCWGIMFGSRMMPDREAFVFTLRLALLR